MTQTPSGKFETLEALDEAISECAEKVELLHQLLTVSEEMLLELSTMRFLLAERVSMSTTEKTALEAQAQA